MPPNLSMSTGFGLFRNSNFLTAHERVLALLCIFICCAFAEGSYQESKPGNKKRKARYAVVIA